MISRVMWVGALFIAIRFCLNGYSQTPELVVQIGHHDPVRCVRFSQDGRQALSSSYEAVKLWDVATGRLIRSRARYSAVF